MIKGWGKMERMVKTLEGVVDGLREESGVCVCRGLRMLYCRCRRCWEL